MTNHPSADVADKSLNNPEGNTLLDHVGYKGVTLIVEPQAEERTLNRVNVGSSGATDAKLARVLQFATLWAFDSCDQASPRRVPVFLMLHRVVPEFPFFATILDARQMLGQQELVRPVGTERLRPYPHRHAARPSIRSRILTF
jgi:hypothetical protein